MLVGAALCALALLLPAPGAHAARGCAAPGRSARSRLLAVFTALSITWSLMPNDSWLETNRTLAYFAALAGGLALGRLRAGTLERAAGRDRDQRRRARAAGRC